MGGSPDADAESELLSGLPIRSSEEEGEEGVPLDSDEDEGVQDEKERIEAAHAQLSPTRSAQCSL
eukprot:5261328-Pyramimonas_sp.AAC.1